MLIFGWVLDLLLWTGTPLRAVIYYFAVYVSLGAAITAVLRRRMTVKK